VKTVTSPHVVTQLDLMLCDNSSHCNPSVKSTSPKTSVCNKLYSLIIASYGVIPRLEQSSLILSSHCFQPLPFGRFRQELLLKIYKLTLLTFEQCAHPFSPVKQSDIPSGSHLDASND